MEYTTASLTALICAFARALHTRADAQQVLCDPWGDVLVPAVVKTTLRKMAVAKMGRDDETVIDDWVSSIPFYPGVITRSRYTEDVLASAICRGVRQYVLVGAGFDSYFLRRPANSEELVIHEIDHPATQALKLEQLKNLGMSSPHAVHFLAADLATEELDAVLSRSTFVESKPAMFSWLGVSPYLTREANLRTLQTIARSSAAGSELVFTYHDQVSFQADIESDNADIAQIARKVRAQGEPFLSGFYPNELAQDLKAVGMQLVEDLSDAQTVARYDPKGSNKWNPPPIVRIAHARII